MTMNELWVALNKCADENGRFPSVQVFSEYSKLPYETISKVYRRWLQENKLIRNGNYYDFPNNKKIELQAKIQEKPLLQKIKSEGLKSLNSKEKKSFTQILVRILTGFIGFVLVACSVHFTYDFNSLAMDKIWGFLLSFAIVVFTSFAFTISSYIDKKFTKVAISILWFLGIAYSVFTAVSGQFNDFRQYTASDTTVVIQNQEKILKSQLKAAELKQDKLSHWRDEEAKYTANTDLKTENPGTWRTIQNGVLELSKVENEIKDIQEKLLNNISVDNTSNETVYNWLSGFLHVNAAIIQFIVTLFPALFIDLCSSICLTFALGKKNEK